MLFTKFATLLFKRKREKDDEQEDEEPIVTDDELIEMVEAIEEEGYDIISIE